MSANAPKHARASKAGKARGFAKSVAGDIATRTNATVAALLALVGVTGVSGGFEEAEPEGYIFAAASQSSEPVELAVEPFDIHVRRTYMVGNARVVEIRLTLDAKRPMDWAQFMQAFDLENSALPAQEQPRFDKQSTRLAGDEPLTELPLIGMTWPNPGVPMDIALIFKDADGTNPGAAENADTLVISSMEYRKSFLDGSMRWLSGERTAEVALK